MFWDGEAKKIIKLAENKKIVFIVTEKILQEIVDVLSRESKFQKFLKERNKNIESVIRKIISISEIIETKTKLNVIKIDSSDDKFLEASIDGNANNIISYDKHLLDLKEFKGIKIINPTEFLNSFS